MTLGSDREVASESFVLSSLPGNKSIVEACIASAASLVTCSVFSPRSCALASFISYQWGREEKRLA
jgi:hypothetical protein